MRSGALPLMALAVVASCHEYRTEPTRARSVPSGSSTSVPAPPVVPEYLPADDPARAQPGLAPTPGSPDGGTLIGGLRIDKNGAVARDVGKQPLAGGARVPVRFGKGFLFWSSSTLYFAKTFLGRLEPITSLPTGVSRVSFGPSQVLLHFSGGGRWALSVPGYRRSTLPAPGLIDVLALGDGRAVMLSEPDRVLTRATGSSTWKLAAARASDLTEVSATEDGIWFRLGSNRALRLGNGSLSELGGVPELFQRAPKSIDPRWPKNASERPRQRAIRRGLALEPLTALVEIDGAFARIDLVSGEIRGMTPAVIASPRECELVALEKDALAVCRTQHGSAVISGVTGSAPKIEKAFDYSASFFAGKPGTLALGGPCSGRPEPSEAGVCVRQKDGSWRELGKPVKADAGSPGDAGMTRGAVPAVWVPTDDGGALGLVQNVGILDANKGSITPFSDKGHRDVSELFRKTTELLFDHLMVERDGSIVGYTRDGALRLYPDGSVARSPQTFGRLESAGAFALASDSHSRFWQSTDWGQRWVEVAGPPGSEVTRASIQRCSRVGCDLGPWYRLGFPNALPRTREHFDEAPPATVSPAAEQRRLLCHATAPAKTRWATRARAPNGELSEQFDLGARKVPIRSEDQLSTITFSFEGGPASTVRAATLVEQALSGAPESPAWSALFNKPRKVSFYETFGDARLTDSRFTWQDWARARRTGGEPTNPLDTTERNAVPVLSPREGTTDGMLLLDGEGPFLWARAGTPAKALSLGPESADFGPSAAVARDKDELVVLGTSSDCRSRVVSLTAAGSRVLFELPARPLRLGCAANPDALGISSDGSIVVIRMPSREPPTADDPALALSQGSAPVPLAPWSALQVGPCPSEASYRALIVPRTAWLGLDLPGADIEPEAPLAVVRWGARHVCLEAAELGGGSISLGDQSLPTAVMARFGTKPEAIRRGFALGAEHVETLDCRLAN